MFQEKTIEDWLTLSGPDTDQVVTQDCDLWVDAEGWDAVRYRTWILKATNVSLAVETATSVEGPWSSLYTKTAVADGHEEIECDSLAIYQLARYLRWKLTSTGASWKACFTVKGTFEKDEMAQQYSGSQGSAAQVPSASSPINRLRRR